MIVKAAIGWLVTERFAFSLSQNECNPDNKSKGLFRLAYSQEIPDEMFERNKAGFMMPHRFMKSYGNITKKICNDYSNKTKIVVLYNCYAKLYFV